MTLTLVGAATGTSIDVPIAVNETEPATRDIQILGTNDFHGRLQREGGSPTAGAAVLSGAVKQLRAANPDTAFVAAGDLIGASTFESFIAKDVPTIDSLNEAGLDVSAAGNHEFDKGYDDLVNRVEPLADWEYIAANIRNNGDNTHALAPDLDPELRVGHGRLRGCGDRGPARAGLAGGHLGDHTSPTSSPRSTTRPTTWRPTART